MTNLSFSLPTARRHDAKPLAEVVRHFTPNWFTVTMGTGVVALTLNQLPPAFSAAHAAAPAFWLADIGLFTLFSLLYLARWICFFDGARRIFHHPVMSMFFGAIPMGLATIVNGFIAFGPHFFGDAAFAIAHVLWWIDVAMSLVCGLAIPYFMFTRQEHSIEKMTAVWLLPIVAAEVAAASGANLVPHLAAPEGFGVLLLGYVLWAYSVPLALSMLVLLVLRLALHKLPGSEMGASAWLALGPIGTGALGVLSLGADAPAVFAAHGLAAIGQVALGLGVVGGVTLWGYGLWWLALALVKTIRYVRQGLPFNLGWWAFTFPLGVYTLSTFALARVTHFAPFTTTATLLTAALFGFWLIVAARTLHGAWHRYLFVAPCLGDGRLGLPLRVEASPAEPALLLPGA